MRSILLLVLGLPPQGLPAAVDSFAFCVQHDHIIGGATQPLHHSTSSTLSTWATCNTSLRETVRAVERIFFNELPCCSTLSLPLSQSVYRDQEVASLLIISREATSWSHNMCLSISRHLLTKSVAV